MTLQLEFEGKNATEAVAKACQELNLPKEKIRYEILSYGSSGIFGLVGVKPARIRVTVPKQEISRSVHPELEEEPQDPSPPPVEDKGLTTDIDDNSEQEIEEENKEPEEAPEEQTKAQEEIPIEEQNAAAARGLDLLSVVAQSIMDEPKVSLEKVKDYRVSYNVEGDDSGLLIGRRGQTLDAVHYMVEKVVNKGQPSKIRVRVDAGGYLARREQSLVQLARRLGEKVKRSGKPASFSPMNAHERKIVHLALKHESGVRTQSRGSGYLRKLVILPQKRRAKKRN